MDLKVQDLLDEFARKTVIPMKDWESYRKFILLSDREGQVKELERLAELAVYFFKERIDKEILSAWNRGRNFKKNKAKLKQEKGKNK